MRCSDYEELLSANASNELAQTQREFIEEHLSNCADCMDTLRSYKSVRQHLSALKDIQPNPNLKDTVMLKIKGTKPRTRKWLRPALVSFPIIAIMIALLIIQPWSATNGHQGVLAKVITASEDIQSYRVARYWSSRPINRPDAEPIVSERFWEFILPDRAHAVFNHSYNSISNGVVTLIEESGEFFIIGNSLYSRTDNDRGMSLGNGNVFALSGGIPTKEHGLGILQFMFELQQLPDENIDGVDCLHYKGIPKLGNIPAEIWIGKDDYFIRQITQIHEGDYELSTYSTRYYDFNTDITIEPPLTASGELLPGWEVENIQSAMSLIPVDEAIKSITGDEDWSDINVLMEAMEVMAKVTNPMAYFNALPSEAQEAIYDIITNIDDYVTTTTTVESLEFNDGILRYHNSGTGQDVVIDVGEVNDENSGVTVDTTAIVDLWNSTILAPDPQAYFDALPEETRQEMVIALSDSSVFSQIMDAID